MKINPDATFNRSQRITKRYFAFVQNRNTNKFMELNEMAKELAVAQTHLTDTVKKIIENHCSTLTYL